MFKRLIMGLLAAGLLVAWVLPETEASVFSRYYRSIVTEHKDCENCETVTDRIYGVSEVNDEYVASCRMTGLVFCDPVVYDPFQCPVVTDAADLAKTDFVALDVNIADGSAITEADLDRDFGQMICNDRFGYLDAGNEMPATIFRTFWPQDEDDFEDVPDFVAVTTYTYSDGNTTEIKQIGFKPTVANLDGVLVAVLEDYTGSLPCCGENTLTVEVEGGVGKVTSSDGNIDCPGTCFAIYDSADPPLYNACPEVVLTAKTDECDLSGSCYAFTGWDGGDCDGIELSTCRTSAKGDPTVTATFEVSYHTLKVVITGGGGKGKAYIWSPRSDFDVPNEYYCGETCYKKFGDTPEFPIGQFVVIKRQGAPFSNWGGVCAGTPNSSDTCSFYMTESIDVVVNFFP